MAFELGLGNQQLLITQRNRRREGGLRQDNSLNKNPSTFLTQDFIFLIMCIYVPSIGVMTAVPTEARGPEPQELLVCLGTFRINGVIQCVVCYEQLLPGSTMFSNHICTVFISILPFHCRIIFRGVDSHVSYQ